MSLKLLFLSCVSTFFEYHALVETVSTCHFKVDLIDVNEGSSEVDGKSRRQHRD